MPQNAQHHPLTYQKTRGSRSFLAACYTPPPRSNSGTDINVEYQGTLPCIGQWIGLVACGTYGRRAYTLCQRGAPQTISPTEAFNRESGANGIRTTTTTTTIITSIETWDGDIHPVTGQYWGVSCPSRENLQSLGFLVLGSTCFMYVQQVKTHVES